jgi:predicted metal-dependent hydrolase
MMRKILGAWAAFFMPRFHPWNEDDRGLIVQAERELGYTAPADRPLAEAV